MHPMLPFVSRTQIIELFFARLTLYTLIWNAFRYFAE